MGLFDGVRKRLAPRPAERDTLIDLIEKELRTLGWVRGEVGAPLAVSSAFGLGEMPFEDWLGKVFLPRLREAQREKRWPTSSSVAVAATRNLDGDVRCVRLLELLGQLDDDINRSA